MRTRKTLRATLGEIVGYAVAFWPGLLLAGEWARPGNLLLIPISGLLSAGLVALAVKYWLMRVVPLRPALRWAFPVGWITGEREPDQRRRRKR